MTRRRPSSPPASSSPTGVRLKKGANRADANLDGLRTNQKVTRASGVLCTIN